MSSITSTTSTYVQPSPTPVYIQPAPVPAYVQPPTPPSPVYVQPVPAPAPATAPAPVVDQTVSASKTKKALIVELVCIRTCGIAIEISK